MIFFLRRCRIGVSLGSFVLLLLTRSESAQALTFLGGALSLSPAQSTVARDGAANALGTLVPSVGVTGEVGVFQPRFLLSGPRVGHDSTYSAWSGQLNLPLRGKLLGLPVRLGPGVWTTYRMGGGRSVELINGASTATYSSPNRATLSMNWIVSTGFTIPFTSTWELQADVSALEVLSSQRDFHGSLLLGWRMR